MGCDNSTENRESQEEDEKAAEATNPAAAPIKDTSAPKETIPTGPFPGFQKGFYLDGYVRRTLGLMEYPDSTFDEFSDAWKVCLESMTLVASRRTPLVNLLCGQALI